MPASIRRFDHQSTIVLRSNNGAAFGATCDVPEERCSIVGNGELEIVERIVEPGGYIRSNVAFDMIDLGDRTHPDIDRTSPYFQSGGLEPPFALEIILPNLRPLGDPRLSRSPDILCATSGLPPPAGCRTALDEGPFSEDEIFRYVIEDIRLPAEVLTEIGF